MNGKIWYCMFLYGASQHQYRASQWQQFFQLLHSHTHFLIIGDINQLDQYSDKIGGSHIIRGWEDIVNRKIRLQLQDIPFTGPRFTWTNNRENKHLIMERLDRAYASLDWINDYPETCLRNLPITFSDHGPIFLKISDEAPRIKRPYQVEKLELAFQGGKRYGARNIAIQYCRLFGFYFDTSSSHSSDPV